MLLSLTLIRNENITAIDCIIDNVKRCKNLTILEI